LLQTGNCCFKLISKLFQKKSWLGW